MKRQRTERAIREKVLRFENARKGVGSKRYNNIVKRDKKIYQGIRQSILNGESYKWQVVLRRTLQVSLLLVLCVSITLVSSLIGVVSAYSRRLEDIDLELSIQKSGDESRESTIVDRNGKEIYRLRGDILKESVKLSEVPKKLQWAFLAAEDAQFYEHKGLNLIGTSRAVICNFQHNSVSDCGGGSSITQQLVKITTEKKQKSLDRKIGEAIMAMQLEKTHTKDQILERYLNVVPQGGILEGVKTGSKYLFGKTDMNDLSLAQMAYLAAIANEPTVLSPWGNKTYDKVKSVERVNYVLDRMLSVKDKSGVTEEEVSVAKLEVPTLEFKSKDVPKQAPHYVDYVMEELDKIFATKKGINGSGRNFLRDQGYTVITAVDLDVQNTLEETIKKQAITPEFQRVVGAQNAAGVIMNPQNGEIIAMVGSRDFNGTSTDARFKPQDNAAIRPRSLGSTNKPPLYLTALRMGYDPGQLLPDEPLDLRAPGSLKSYIVKNYSRKYGEYGNPITMRNALRNSLNVPAVTTFHLVGPDAYIDTYMKLNGWKDIQDADGIRYPPAPLGAANIPLLEQVHAYATMAADGMYYPKKSILEIRDKEGNIVYNNRESKGKQVIDPKFIFLINDMNKHYWLFDVHPLLKKIGLTTDIAGKTGTGDNGDGTTSDVAFMAYTPTAAMGMWAGNSCSANNCPLEGKEPTGENLYNYMFSQFLTAYAPKIAPGRFGTPPGVKKKSTCETITVKEKDSEGKEKETEQKIQNCKTSQEWMAEGPYDSYLGEKRDVMAIVNLAKKQKKDKEDRDNE
jgi:penicillin-binding protein 1A